MRRSISTLSGDEAILYAEQLRTATKQQMALARLLQRAAFAHIRERVERYADGTFVPAPLYMAQAFTITGDHLIRVELFALVHGDMP